MDGGHDPGYAPQRQMFPLMRSRISAGQLHWAGLAQVGGDQAGRAAFRFVKKRDRGDDLTRSAIAALIAVVVEERLLHRVPRSSPLARPSIVVIHRRRAQRRAPGNY